MWGWRLYGTSSREWGFDVMESLGLDRVGLGLLGLSVWLLPLDEGRDGWMERRIESWVWLVGWVGVGKRSCGAGLLFGSLLIITVQLCRFQRWYPFFSCFSSSCSSNSSSWIMPLGFFLVLVSIWVFSAGLVTAGPNGAFGLESLGDRLGSVCLES